MTRALAFLVVLAAALGLAVPTHAGAHSELARLSVGADEVRLTFSAPVEAAFARVEVRNADRRVVSGDPRLDRDDPNTIVAAITPGQQGVGEVTWTVLSRDGHVTRGGGIGSAWADTAAAIGRLLILAGLVVAGGLVAIRWWVAGAAWRSGGLVPPARPRDDEGFRRRTLATIQRADRVWARASVVAWSAVLAGTGLLATGTLAGLGGGVADIAALADSTRLGTVLVVVAVAAVAGLLVRIGSGDRDLRGVVASGPAAVGLTAMSWGGHASSDRDAGIAIGVDAVHNLATAAWIGGLTGLLGLIVCVGFSLQASDRVRLMAPVVVRFSSLATLCVALLVVTGIYRALSEVGSWDALVDTTYGQALLVKLAVFVVMLFVGGYNRFVLHTRLERAALGLDEMARGTAAADALGRSVRAELMLAGLVLIAVAVLVATAPPA